MLTIAIHRQGHRQSLPSATEESCIRAIPTERSRACQQTASQRLNTDSSDDNDFACGAGRNERNPGEEWLKPGPGTEATGTLGIIGQEQLNRNLSEADVILVLEHFLQVLQLSWFSSNEWPGQCATTSASATGQGDGRTTGKAARAATAKRRFCGTSIARATARRLRSRAARPQDNREQECGVATRR